MAGDGYGLSGDEAAALLRQLAHLATESPAPDGMNAAQRAAMPRFLVDLFIVCEEAEKLPQPEPVRKSVLGSRDT